METEKQPDFQFRYSAIEAVNFTDKQLAILKLVAEEKTSQEIADQLGLKPRTVENNIDRMRAVVGCKKSVGLVAYALRNKIIE